MSEQKVRENRCRRMAARQRLRLMKSRRRDPRAFDFGLYVLVDASTKNLPVRPRWKTLDEIEGRLTGRLWADRVRPWQTNQPRGHP